MTLPSTLRLDKLTLRNFRCFAECTIDLHPELTVLVADNAKGKTAILDAIGIAFGLFVRWLSKTEPTHGFSREDIRVVRKDSSEMVAVLPTEFRAEGIVCGQPLKWNRTLASSSRRARTSLKKALGLEAAAIKLLQELNAYEVGSKPENPILPFIAFYGTGRLWSTHRLTEGRRTIDRAGIARLTAYSDCLSSSSSFKSFVLWYRTMNGLLKGGASRALGRDERPEAQLAAVNEAVRIVLEPTGWRNIGWHAEGRTLVVEHPDLGRLPLSLLSDGVRNMIALVADIAHRCVRLNPQFGEEAARRTPGILLIDEVDMHLHPRWQQLVMDLLRRAFPTMQMVVTTHSPHVLSTVDKSCIRVVRLQDSRGVLETPSFQTRGVESADVLATIMGVDPMPQVEEASWLSAYRGMIEDGLAEQSDALVLRAKIVNHFGEKHPLVLDCDRLLRFQALRRNRVAKAEG